MTKGGDFLAEAERLKDEEPTKITLTYLQGLLLLYEKFVVLTDFGVSYTDTALGTLCLERMISDIECYTKQSGLDRIWDLSVTESLDSRQITISRGIWMHLLDKLPGVCSTLIRVSPTLSSLIRAGTDFAELCTPTFYGPV